MTPPGASGWGEWVPPAEQRAANEAAEKFAVERAAADDRTRTLADSIAFGLDRVALAIVAAAGGDAVRRYQQIVEAGFDDEPSADTFGAGAFTSADLAEHRRPPADPDLDDLLDDGDADPNG